LRRDLLAHRKGPVPVKVVIAGGFGVGKTTLVGSISDIAPLTTEGSMTTMASETDDRSEVQTKVNTTVAMDFGRVSIDEKLMLYLFGTPGQDRFGFMWDDLIVGALGAVVVLDSRRLEDSYPALDYFEHRDVPFIVAVNRFEGTPMPDLDEIRDAMDIAADIPIVVTDARSRDAVKQTLLALMSVVLRRARNLAA
jgi:signal recognition particle receptor subunit beta